MHLLVVHTPSQGGGPTTRVPTTTAELSPAAPAPSLHLPRQTCKLKAFPSNFFIFLLFKN